MAGKDLANLKCPYCGYIMKLEIPQKGCLVFWKCENTKKAILATSNIASAIE